MYNEHKEVVVKRRAVVDSRSPDFQKRALLGSFVLAILAVVGCSGMFGPSREYREYLNTMVPAPMVTSEEAAQLSPDQESVTRYLASNLFAETKLKAKKTGRRYIYYLKVLGKNPDSRILKDLQDECVSLKPASEGRLLADCVYDPAADWAELYSISNIQIADGIATVEASFYWGPLSAAGYEYRLVRKGETWEFIRSKMRWIS
jgi:hypothetical protein